MADYIGGIPIIPGEGSIECLERTFRDGRLSAHQRLVMLGFASIASDTWDTVVSCADLARAIGVSDDFLRTIASELVKSGRLAVRDAVNRDDPARSMRWFELYPIQDDLRRDGGGDVLACLEWVDPEGDSMSDWGADILSAPVVH